MYGAKAEAIVKVARETFEVPVPQDPAAAQAEHKAILQSVFDIYGDNNIEVAALTEIPKVLKNETYIRLVIALAESAFVQ